MTMQNKVQALLDREDIRNLRTLYSHLLDGNMIDALDRVFSRDAVVEVTVGRMKGLDEIRAGLKDAFGQFDRDARAHYPFLHAVTNHAIELTGPETARGRCYLIDWETASKPDPNPLLLLGIYDDEYRRIEGEWRITRSRLDVVWPATGSPSDATAGR